MHTTAIAQANHAAPGKHAAPAGERFLVLPIIILILAQMGATGDSGALSLAASALTADLGATTSDIQLANMIYPLVGGAFMIAGGLLGTIIGWKRTFRMGTLLCAAGEVVLALPERDAAQSGGIQSTMRSVGQAFGVAFLGAVLSGAAAPRRLRLVRWAQRPMSSTPAAWGAAWAPTAIPRRYRASRYRVDIPGARCCRPCAW